ncbi:MAG: tetratricopeptide repeat protein [Planctomycetes bacterium]|nr:tetratricopeptide repeat protein [Planctomycetota bacterium]
MKPRISRIIILAVFLLFGLPIYAEQSETELIEKLSLGSVPDKEIDLAEAALIIAKTVYPDASVEIGLTQVNLMANEIKNELGDSTDHYRILAAINSCLYDRHQYSSESILSGDNASVATPDKFLLNQVLDNNKGNCLGSSTLYFALAERLNLPLEAVIVPQHVFLRYRQDGKYRNIETTAGGGEITDKEYKARTKKLVGDIIPAYSTGHEIRLTPIHKKGFVGLIIYNRGVWHLQQGAVDEALNDFANSLKLLSDFTEAYKSRGAVYLKKGQFADAARDLRNAVRLEPDCPNTYYNLGVAYFNMNELIDARRNFDKAIELTDDYADAYLNRGIVYWKQQHTNYALKDITGAIEIKPTPQAYYNRGLIYLGKKDNDEAIKDFTSAISLDNKFSDAYNNRGIAYAAKEQWDDAISDFKDAVFLKPDGAEAYKNLGATYYRLARYEEALTAFERYLKQKDDKEIKKLVEDLKQRGK